MLPRSFDRSATRSSHGTSHGSSYRLAAIRAVHSGVFLVELAAIAWLVLTGLTGRRDRSVALAGGLVAIEAAVFVASRGVCPLTPLAEGHGASSGSVSDIFLPDVVARTIPMWATTLVAIGVVQHVRAALRRSASPARRSGGLLLPHAAESHRRS